MRRLGCLSLLGVLLVAGSAQAQMYSDPPRRKAVQSKPVQAQPVQTHGARSPRNAVSTRPSNSPFTNPIFQPLPPAVSVNPAQNSNRSTVPLGVR
jgi:hypothetical protein